MIKQPYIGLRPFERNETAIFFGRERHSDELIQRLGTNHFLAVIGTSGCGKSSLVKTGLIAGLEAGYLAKAGTHWFIVEMRPGTQPFQALAEKLFLALKNVLPRSFDEKSLEIKLRKGSLSLHELLARYPLPNQAQLLIICDQFEEIFRFKNQNIPAEIRNFVSLLLASSKAYPLSDTVVSHSIYVVLTMRSDFLGDCAQFRGLAEAINQGLYLTPRLDAEQLREAIEEPALMCNGEIEPALVTRLLEDAQHNQDQLPLLQHILMRLWELQPEDVNGKKIITEQAYLKEGGLNGNKNNEDSRNALSRHADEIFDDLILHQDIAESMFRALTDRMDNQRDTRRPTPVSEIMALSGAGLEEVTVVIDAFRKEGRCFLMPPMGVDIEEDTVIDISHESFIRQWKRLQNGVIAEARSAEQYRRLEETALRHARGEVGLLKNPELRDVLQWKKTFNPTLHWAQRYSKGENNFQQAFAFLQKSKNRSRLMKLWFSSIFLVFALLAVFIFIQKEEKEKKEQENQRLIESANITVVDNRYLILANGTEVKDLQTNLIWQRCQVGMKWDGNTCTGEANGFTFDEAQKQAGNGWRVPTIRELSSLIVCSSGKMTGERELGDGGTPIKRECGGEYTSPTINTKAFPNTPASVVWSGSPFADNAGNAWGFDFDNGGSNYHGRYNNGGRVRLVRGGQ